MLILADINECVLENPCRNGATCINNAGSYQCICLPGFSGPHCVDGKCLCYPSRLISLFVIISLESLKDKLATCRIVEIMCEKLSNISKYMTLTFDLNLKKRLVVVRYSYSVNGIC